LGKREAQRTPFRKNGSNPQYYLMRVRANISWCSSRQKVSSFRAFPSCGMLPADCVREGNSRFPQQMSQGMPLRSDEGGTEPWRIGCAANRDDTREETPRRVGGGTARRVPVFGTYY